MHALMNDYILMRLAKERHSELLLEARNERVLMRGADRLRDAGSNRPRLQLNRRRQ